MGAKRGNLSLQPIRALTHILVRHAAPFFLVAVALGQLPPAADHHAHLQSPAAAVLLTNPARHGGAPEQPHTASDLIAVLDAAHISQSVALSDAYRFGAPWVHIADEANQVDRENAWTAAQAAEYPGRLVPFCSVNPLKPYAQAAILRCHALGMRALKLHLANAGFHFDRPEDVRSLAAVFALADRLRMAVLIHLRTGEHWESPPAMHIFFDQVLPQAPDVPVQVAHLTGWGNYDCATDAGLSTLLDLCASRAAACQRLYFDLAAVILPADAAAQPPGSGERLLAEEQAGFPEGPHRLAANLRRIRAGHVLFATDWPVISPAAYVGLLRAQLLVRPGELEQILANRAPYFALTRSRHPRATPAVKTK